VDLSASANDFKAVITAIRRDLRQRSAAAERRAEVARNRIERLQEEAARLRARGGENMEEALSRLQSSIASLQLEVRRREGEARSLRQEANRPNFVVNLSNAQPSYLVFMNEGVVKLQEVRAERATGQVLVPLNSTATAARGDWYMLELSTPEGDRRFKDQAIAWVEKLEEAGLLKTNFNHRLFTNASSQEPELAGLAGALSGTFWTMLVTLILSFPIGVAAAIYLEEFAPKNRLTDLIEVNINNLAAVPSIVFGLLGLAVFLNTLGLPRSSPLVGGMVLALMTLPTIIIASRAALKAVPPSVRQAALSLGASRVQTTFQQVVPQALPGIFTGSIIGMAQALGETAPLLMIGMVAFIAEVPGGISDPAAVMPVQIFLWSGEPERAFAERTSAAILVLLGFLVVMNAIAVILRRRFEQRWT
jgi:phosphate transport system permease protein